MKFLTIPIILSFYLMPVFAITGYAETMQKPYSIKKRVEQDKPLPSLREGGAHGSHNPHAKLTPEMHVQVALQHKAEGRMGEAFKELDLAISTNNMSAELFAVRGSFYLEQNNVTQALSDFESALKIAPDSPVILTNRAQVYRQFGRISEALRDLDKAIKLNPDLMAAYFNRGAIHYSSGEYKLALKDFDTCIAIDPHAAGPYFNRASSKDASGDRQGAIEDIKHFMEMTDNSQWKTTAQQLLEKWQSVLPGSDPAKSNS